MSFYVYMLKSKSIKPITYVGYTSDLKKRIVLHNSGKGAKFTRGRKWVLIYKEKFKSKSEAISREYYIKKNRSIRNKLKNEYLNTVTL
jgi:putative endonuclease